MDVAKSLQNLLSGLPLDVRKSNNGRWMDQKVTPDVLSFIADSILQLPEKSRTVGFTKNDVWHSPYLKSNVKLFFGKPSADNKTAENEYDKFVSQPMKTLAYAGILSESKSGNTNVYTVREVPLLQFISLSQANAFTFLSVYIQEVLKASGVMSNFERFFSSSQTDEDLQVLKDIFHNFIVSNTPIKGRTEMARIFPKVLNPLACSRGLKGTERGHVSKFAIQFSDLCYNSTNWRDVGKDKRLTRREHSKLVPTPSLIEYEMRKAMTAVRARHFPISEMNDEWAVGEATQVHHIFPKSTHPELAAVKENLILLTPTQHFTKAHPSNKTSRVNKEYQISCLIAKIEKLLEEEKTDLFYTDSSMKNVLDVGLGIKVQNGEKWEEVISRLHDLKRSSS